MTQTTASAPGKAILFGEHAVVYKKPAIAVAVDKRAEITITPTQKQNTTFTAKQLQIKAEIQPQNNTIQTINGKPGILQYILETLKIKHNNTPININLKLNMPIGAGLGSSAAITVALIAALDQHHKQKINKQEIAKTAHQIEQTVQGSASPLDTATSTYGGLIFLNENQEIHKLNSNLKKSMIIGYTSHRGNTGEMVAKVQKAKNEYPQIMNPIIDSIGNITLEAKKIFQKETLTKKEFNTLADLMNINQGLLDSIGVNTQELSNMIYTARKNGAIGSKLTGAGGGGSIIALCPGKTETILKNLKLKENAIEANFSKEGVIIH